MEPLFIELQLAGNPVASILAGFGYGLDSNGGGLSSDQEPIVIGLEAPLSGSQKANGRDMWRGAKLAAEELNLEGGILGRPIELVKADDRADPERALPVARKLKRLGADAVIGPYNSGVGILNLPYYLENEIVPVHLTSTDDTDGEGVTVQPKNSQIAPVEEAYILSQGIKGTTKNTDLPWKQRLRLMYWPASALANGRDKADFSWCPQDGVDAGGSFHLHHGDGGSA
ncbi:ABC transporter substrate-binding protein [Synechococcus sp. CCY9202]|uniref:ABC transporter substrate-binding protein n=1 Tax=Synechococcus sp. CCY9202 TaxID=174698 RepID=UPI002B21BC99|nr:ABC transporter substrate-binding protein [Synechococcus sp. CCY9202]MEA5421825.1 ABC transporter substrate-binding protein [Synechococcus sp. CCY9202]